MTRGQSYPEELREHAIRMAAEMRPDYTSKAATYAAVASRLGITSPDTLRTWVRRRELNEQPDLGKAELQRLRQENAELRRVNEFLKTAAAYFAAGLVRPGP